MDIGYHLPTTQPARDTHDALVSFAREAERRGAASLWVQEILDFVATDVRLALDAA